jgi:hypothetical protein
MINLSVYLGYILVKEKEEEMGDEVEGKKRASVAEWSGVPDFKPLVPRRFESESRQGLYIILSEEAIRLASVILLWDRGTVTI